MLVVTAIEVYEVKDDEYYLPKFPPADTKAFTEGYQPRPGWIDAGIRETIRGTMFRNSRNEKVIVGYSTEVQKILGLPFSAFDDMKKENSALLNDNMDLHKKLRFYREMTFWKRVKFLFQRKKVNQTIV